MVRSVVCCCFAAVLPVPYAWAFDEPVTHPLTAAERQKIQQKYRRVIESTDDIPPTVSIHSRRGDARMFLRDYKQAVEEYLAMVKLQPELDASHWRLGIALFFNGQPETAAAQFDKYHSFDDVDRENGIWRFLCHYRAFGAERAAKELLRYEKDDRQPFPVVYRLFDGSVTPEEALEQVSESLPASERDKRLFYTELYIGLLKTVQDDRVAARDALRSATSREWPRTAGFGPAYMWQVGRMQFDELTKTDE
ncbi:MAG: hypothetical protein MK110_13310 [Fuerstiella sp.]|nr:hypothetical protein [Fuerstiella sp.]